MKYKTGKEIPSNVISAILFMGKSGFMTNSIWRKNFAVGNERWARRQIQLLIERRIFECHPNPIAINCFVLGPFGHILLAKYGKPCAPPPYVSQLVHDEVVAESMLALSKSGVAYDWHLEIEMKSEQMKLHQLNSCSKDRKYSDAIFKMNVRDKDHLCALEYERTRKNPRRYRDILWLYSNMSSIWLVIFICENESISSMIQRQLEFLRDPALSSRVAIVAADQWIKDPLKGSITLDGAGFDLEGLCSNKGRAAA